MRSQAIEKVSKPCPSIGLFGSTQDSGIAARLVVLPRAVREVVVLEDLEVAGLEGLEVADLVVQGAQGVVHLVVQEVEEVVGLQVVLVVGVVLEEVAVVGLAVVVLLPGRLLWWWKP